MPFNSAPSPESSSNIREQAIAAYKPFIEQGIQSPDDLDLSDPQVQAANDLFKKFQTEEDTKAQGDEEKMGEANFNKTIFYVDAGFTDPSYLRDVLGWLDQDLENVEEGSAKPFPALAEKIKAKMQEIKVILGE
jgi:hypothetical protein